MGQTRTIDTAAAATVVPPAVLDNLAARLRPGGLFVLAARPDGTVTWHDGAAGPFFSRYVLPRLAQSPARAELGIGPRIAALGTDSGTAIWDVAPGVTVAALPVVERRQVQGVVLLAGKGSGFALTEAVGRACSQLGLDAAWLEQQAAALPAYDADALAGQAELLAGMLRDQLRLTGLEQEVDSLSGQLANTYEELSLVYQISSGMKVNRPATEFFKQACLEVMEVANVRGMGAALRVEGASGQAPVLYGRLAVPPGEVRRLTEQLVGVLAARGGPLLVNNLGADRQFAWLAPHARQLIAVPLQRQEQVLGCLFALDKVDGEFDSVDAKLLTAIANESAIYLENLGLFEDVHDLMMGLLHALVNAVDAKDTYTCGHSERVALLGRLLAQRAGLTDAQVERVYMGGLLHDVGKIGVPEAVLCKPGKLTPEEFGQMKKHPQIGARILQDIKQVADIVPGVLCHHERYDGRGYPAGLAGTDIPVIGRIICLADCFDAMTSNRTYRRALPLEVALTEIRRCAGTQFDPALAEVFLEISAGQFRLFLDDHGREARRVLDGPDGRLAKAG